jgi:hypothetical protein
MMIRGDRELAFGSEIVIIIVNITPSFRLFQLSPHWLSSRASQRYYISRSVILLRR